jgi:hypothetical protein
VKNAVDWLFKNRETGEITIWQWPNIPLWAFIAASVLAALVKNGSAHGVFSVLAAIALVVWAVLEIMKGVNPFRRGLGAVVLIGMIVSRLLK